MVARGRTERGARVSWLVTRTEGGTVGKEYASPESTLAPPGMRVSEEPWLHESVDNTFRRCSKRNMAGTTLTVTPCMDRDPRRSQRKDQVIGSPREFRCTQRLLAPLEMQCSESSLGLREGM